MIRQLSPGQIPSPAAPIMMKRRSWHRETGNELEDTNADFLHQTAAWIKKWALISWWWMAPIRKLIRLR